MFGNQESIRMIASIRAMRLDNTLVDGLTVPSGWLAENGVQVSVTRELSVCKEDGSLAHAGESYHNRVTFVSENGLEEHRIFRLPGSSRGTWPQSSVDSEVYAMLDKNEHLAMLNRQREEKRLAAQRDHESRIQKRDTLIALFFERHGKPVQEYRTNQLVATLDGLIWKMTPRIHNGKVVLVAYGVPEKFVLVPFDAILIPANDHIIREFRSMLRGISY